MRTKRIIVVLLVALMSVAGAWAHEHRFASDDEAHSVCLDCGHGFFRYEADAVVTTFYAEELKGADGNALTIISNTCTAGHGVIEFDRPLVIIGESAFDHCEDFTGSLVIPNTVTTIGDYAFNACRFTGSLTIPNSVTTIGISAFWQCTGFTGTLTIGNSVKTIGYSAFNMCSGFSGNLTIPNSVTSIGGFAFNMCSGFSGNLTIPNSVTSIGESAFADCDGFSKVFVDWETPLTISSDVLQNWNLSQKELHIGGCGRLSKYWASNVWNNFQIADAHRFADTDTNHEVCLDCAHNFFRYEASSIVVPLAPSELKGADGNALTIMSNTCTDGHGVIEFEHPLVTIGERVFEQCTGFTGSLTIPNSVTTIGDYAFAATGFTGSLTIPNSVTSIGESAFAATGFTGSLTIPNSVTTIGESAFDGCGEFTGELTIGNSVTSIGASAFDHTGFTGSLVIPNTVTTIGDYAFNACRFTGSLTIPNSVTTIGISAFWQCTGFSGTLTIGNSVKTIGYSAFNMCSGFTGNLIIPNSVTSIGGFAFNHCSGLTGKLDIGNSVETIQESAFEGCSNLSDVTLRSIPRFYNEYAFSDVTANKSVALDDNSYVYTSSNPYFPTMNAPTTFTRLMSNEWETIVLPFSVAANGADYNLYSFTSVNGELIELTKLSGNVAAGTPVLIHLAPVAMASNSDDYELTLTAVDPEVSIAIATPSVKDGLALTGTYKDIDLTEEPGYVVTNNDAYKISTVSDPLCKPFHAYFAGVAAGSPDVLSLNSPDIPTGIEEVKMLNEEGAEYYDINGRRIPTLQPGINIIKFKNGKTQKVMVKGEL